VVARELMGYQHSRAAFDAWLEPPRPELTLMIDLDGWISADGSRLPDAWIGGLSDTYTVVGFGETYGSIDLKLQPLAAYRLQPPLSGAAVCRAGGLSPKTVARLLRFADVRQRIERAPARWAQVAFDVGYADQSHLNRDFRQLAGTTPTDFVARLIPGGGVVGDGCAPAG
jgi:AraC-like DNA-binding protein